MKNLKQYLPLAAIAAGVLALRSSKSVSGVSGTFSRNAKLNNVLSKIYDQVAEFVQENPGDLERYVREFRSQPDYNLAQYGNSPFYIYYEDVKDFYRRAGYTSKMTNDQAWETYLMQIGYVVRTYFK